VISQHDRWLAWTADRYGVLLGILVLDYASLILIDEGVFAAIVAVVSIGATVLFAADVSQVKRHVRIVVRCLVLSLPIAFTIYAAVPSLSRGVVYIIFGVVLASTPVMILGRILGHERINLATVFAALDVYVLIGLVFSLFYIGCWHLQPATPFFSQGGPKDRSDFVYFSYIVLTTVGFGDLTPASKLARTLVVTEALIGQLFLVTAVARVVALFGWSRSIAGDRKSPAEATEDPS
jgi:hypothetical protein